MSFTDAIRTCIGKFATFDGRASRSEFWWFYLFYALVGVVLALPGTLIMMLGIPSGENQMPGPAFWIGLLLLVLAVMAMVLVWAFHAEVNLLIPLYTVGVFIAFTLSQLGLVRRWWMTRMRGWHLRLASNGAGALATGVVAVVVGVSKFALGAWMVLVLLPVLGDQYGRVLERRELRLERQDGAFRLRPPCRCCSSRTGASLHRSIT